MKEIKCLSATGQLGHGIIADSFARGVERKPHVIDADMGSTDIGPYYLGSGNTESAPDMIDRDLELVLVAARRLTVRQASRAHHLASVRYTNGMSTQLEVSDARLIAQQAAADEVQATRDYRLALAQLEHALGRPVPVQVKTLDQIANITQRTEGKQP